jgi:hypothetical protein
MRASRIGATWRELRGQPLVTAMLILAMIAVIMRTALLSVPEIFSGGAAFGSVSMTWRLRM